MAQLWLDLQEDVDSELAYVSCATFFCYFAAREAPHRLFTYSMLCVVATDREPSEPHQSILAMASPLKALN